MCGDGCDGDGCQLIIARKDGYRWQIKTYEADRRLQCAEISYYSYRTLVLLMSRTDKKEKDEQ